MVLVVVLRLALVLGPPAAAAVPGLAGVRPESRRTAGTAEMELTPVGAGGAPMGPCAVAVDLVAIEVATVDESEPALDADDCPPDDVPGVQ